MNRLIAERLRSSKRELPDAELTALQVKLVVFGAAAPVWRRVRVGGGLSVRSFSRVMRRAFGWWVSNEYTLGLRRPWDSHARTALVERKLVRLGDLLGKGDAMDFAYRYSMGGVGWTVAAVVEDVAPAEGRVRATCLAGAGVLAAQPRDWLAYNRVRHGLVMLACDEQRQALALRREGIEREGGDAIDLGAINEELARGRYLVVDAAVMPASRQRIGKRRRR